MTELRSYFKELGMVEEKAVKEDERSKTTKQDVWIYLGGKRDLEEKTEEAKLEVDMQEEAKQE